MTKHSPSPQATARQANDEWPRRVKSLNRKSGVTMERITRRWSLFEFRHSFVIVYSSGFICGAAFENQMQRLRRVNALLDLLLQRALGFGGQVAFCCFFPCKLRQDR